MAQLSDAEINAGLGRVPAWTRRGQTITRTVAAPTFTAAIELVNRVAAAAEEADHHPDMDIRYNEVTFALSTHAAGHLTQRDFALAARIDVLTDV